jgi:hypothetical protein
MIYPLGIQVKKYNKIGLIFCLLAIMITYGCKLDEAPSAVANNNETVLGIVVVGKVVNNTYLTADWKTIRTAQQYYDTAYAAVLGANPMPAKFTSIALNDLSKSFKYNGLANSNIATTGTYSLYTSNNVLFIQLPGNPFFSNPASTVRITNLTASSMTWVVIDPTIITVNGQPAREAYEVVFIR